MLPRMGPGLRPYLVRCGDLVAWAIQLFPDPELPARLAGPADPSTAAWPPTDGRCGGNHRPGRPPLPGIGGAAADGDHAWRRARGPRLATARPRLPVGPVVRLAQVRPAPPQPRPDRATHAGAQLQGSRPLGRLRACNAPA